MAMDINSPIGWRMSLSLAPEIPCCSRARPADRSFDVFGRWFDFQHHLILLDLCDETLTTNRTDISLRVQCGSIMTRAVVGEAQSQLLVIGITAERKPRMLLSCHLQQR